MPPRAKFRHHHPVAKRPAILGGHECPRCIAPPNLLFLLTVAVLEKRKKKKKKKKKNRGNEKISWPPLARLAIRGSCTAVTAMGKNCWWIGKIQSGLSDQQ